MNAGHVYVLAFDNGTVKVGQTQNANQRMSSHKSIARGFGLTVTGEWVSPLHAGWRANEDALKAIAVSLGGTPAGQEYFSGIDFAAVVEKAQELTFPAPEPDVMSPARTADMSARNRAIRDVAAEIVARALAEEVPFARRFLDEGIPADFDKDMDVPTRLGGVMQLILNQENEIRRQYDTVLAIQRRLNGPAN